MNILILKYPNPTHNIFLLEGILKEALQLQIEIVNHLGERITFYDLGKLSSFKNQISMSNFCTGIYFIRVISSENAKCLATKKIVVE